MGDVKSYNVPPAAIERVMTIAIILSTMPSKAGTWDISWPRAKRTISCADRFVMDLLQVKPEQVSEGQMEAVRPYLLDANKFTPVIHEVCEVLGIVWDWIVWLFDYIEVYRKQIVPFEEEKEELEQVLHLANQKLSLDIQQASRIDKDIALLTDKFEIVSSRKSMLQAKVKVGTERYHNAISLIARLQGDEPFWRQERDEKQVAHHNVLGDCLLAAMLLTYCAPLSQAYRRKLFSECKEQLLGLCIPFSSGCQPADILLRPGQEYGWYQEGLPILNFGVRNMHALENCLVSNHAMRVPLLIDPDSVALNWCRALSNDSRADKMHLLVCDDTLMDRLKSCITQGVSVMCTIVPLRCDPLIHSLLQMRVLKKGKDRYLQIGSENVELASGFKLMLRTCDRSHSFPAPVTTRTSIINFQVDADEFEDYLLTIMVAAHEERVQHERDNVLRTLVERTLRVAHDKQAVISMLLDMTGNLSDSEEVQKISQFKTEVDARRVALENTVDEMDVLRGLAAPYLHLSSILAGVLKPIRNLCHLDVAYVFSAQEVLHVLNAHLLHKRKAVQTHVATSLNDQERVHTQGIAPAMAAICLHVAHAVAQEHRDAFLVHSFFEHHVSLGSISREVMAQVLSTSCDTQHKVHLLHKHVAPFEQLHAELSQVASATATPSTSTSTSAQSKAHVFWRSWLASDKPELSPQGDLPWHHAGEHRDSLELDDWQCILVLAVLRPGRLAPAIRRLLLQTLGSRQHMNGSLEEVGGDTRTVETMTLGALHQMLHLHNSLQHAVYVPQNMRYQRPVPIMLLGSNQLDAWNEVLHVATELELLDSTHQSLILSVNTPNLRILLMEAAQKGRWVLLRDLTLAGHAHHFLDCWLDGVAQEPGSTLSNMHKPVRSPGYGHGVEAGDTIQVEARYGDAIKPPYRHPHHKFRLFVCAASVECAPHASFSFGCVWNKCLQFNCTQAAVGMKMRYLKLSNAFLRDTSQDDNANDENVDDLDHLSLVMRRVFLLHLVFNSLSLEGVSGWRFSYEFKLDDIMFAKERIVQVLLARQVPPMQLPHIIRIHVHCSSRGSLSCFECLTVETREGVDVTLHMLVTLDTLHMLVYINTSYVGLYEHFICWSRANKPCTRSNWKIH